MAKAGASQQEQNPTNITIEVIKTLHKPISEKGG